jgi:hypothetical protein
MTDLRRDFWIRETGTGQQVAQLHNRYIMIIILHIYIYIVRLYIYIYICVFCAFLGQDNKVYMIHGTYIRIFIVNIYHGLGVSFTQTQFNQDIKKANIGRGNCDISKSESFRFFRRWNTQLLNLAVYKCHFFSSNFEVTTYFHSATETEY